MWRGSKCLCCMVILLITIFGGGGGGGEGEGDLFGPFLSCNLPCVVCCCSKNK